MARDGSKRLRFRAAVTAVAALAALGVAGVMIVRTVLEEWRTRPETFRRLWASATATGEQAAANRPSPPPEHAVDPAAARTPLGILRVGQGAAARPVVMLGLPTCSEDIDGSVQGSAQSIMLRELIRQAVLIAARDELGLSTRDAVMGEDADQALKVSKGPKVEVVSIFRQGGKSRASIRRTEAKQEKDRAVCDARISGWDSVKFIEAAEKLSRTDFVAALRKLGAEGKPNPRPGPGAEAPLPAGVEESLAGLSFTQLFGAVRTLHRAIRTDGESSLRLAALARAYALLGTLAEFHWHPAHKVFKAWARSTPSGSSAATARVPRRSETAVSGLLLAAQGDEPGAREQFKKARELDQHIGTTIEKLKGDVSRRRNTRQSPD